MQSVNGDRLRAFTASAGAALEDATRAAAAAVAARARELCPVETGRLRESIAADGNAVRADANYAACVEEGARGRPAQPFMRPAAEAEALAERARDAVRGAWEAMK